MEIKHGDSLDTKLSLIDRTDPDITVNALPDYSPLVSVCTHSGDHMITYLPWAGGSYVSPKPCVDPPPTAGTPTPLGTVSQTSDIEEITVCLAALSIATDPSPPVPSHSSNTAVVDPEDVITSEDVAVLGGTWGEGNKNMGLKEHHFGECADHL